MRETNEQAKKRRPVKRRTETMEDFLGARDQVAPAPGPRDARAQRPLPLEPGVPDVGEILQRLRRQRGLSLREVADACGLSASFLSAVERGESDIALGRLAKVAHLFGHDVGSFLGYSTRKAKPYFTTSADRVSVNRGRGVSYEVVRIQGTNFELVTAALEPHSAFQDEITHEGIDIGLVSSGTLVLVYDGVDYEMGEGVCGVWSGAYPHTIRNDSDEPAQILIVVSETVY
jgi:transcriptional regulator with XRE-family HTH domain